MNSFFTINSYNFNECLATHKHVPNSETSYSLSAKKHFLPIIGGEQTEVFKDNNRKTKLTSFFTKISQFNSLGTHSDIKISTE